MVLGPDPVETFRLLGGHQVVRRPLGKGPLGEGFLDAEGLQDLLAQIVQMVRVICVSGDQERAREGRRGHVAPVNAFEQSCNTVVDVTWDEHMGRVGHGHPRLGLLLLRG